MTVTQSRENNNAWRSVTVWDLTRELLADNPKLTYREAHARAAKAVLPKATFAEAARHFQTLGQTFKRGRDF